MDKFGWFLAGLMVAGLVVAVASLPRGLLRDLFSFRPTRSKTFEEPMTDWTKVEEFIFGVLRDHPRSWRFLDDGDGQLMIRAVDDDQCCPLTWAYECVVGRRARTDEVIGLAPKIGVPTEFARFFCNTVDDDPGLSDVHLRRKLIMLLEPGPVVEKAEAAAAPAGSPEASREASR